MTKAITHRRDLRAFSLIELSFSLVVIGILVGGIVVGKSVIGAAERRSVITDANSYISALANFRSQYRYLPGDMPNSTDYWPASSGGNADGQVAGNERFRFWEHLSLAEFVDKRFTGIAGGGGANDFVIRVNIPDSRIKLAGFSLFYANMIATSTLYTVSLGNTLAFGSSAGSNTGAPLNAVLTAAEAFELDSKADDGIPGTGKWIANGTGGGNFGSADSCTTSTSGTDYTGIYRVASSAISCGLFIKSGF